MLANRAVRLLLDFSTAIFYALECTSVAKRIPSLSFDPFWLCCRCGVEMRPLRRDALAIARDVPIDAKHEGI